MYVPIIFSLTIGASWLTISQLILQFPNFIQPWFEEYPNFTCTVLQGETTFIPCLLCVIPILSLTALLKISPFDFEDMNHERFYGVTSILWAFDASVHIIFFLVNYGTLCNARQLTRLIHVRGININKDMFNTFEGTTVLAVDCALLFIPMIVHWIFKIHRKFKSRNINILPLPEPPKVSLINQRILKEGTIPRQLNLTDDYLDFNNQALISSMNRDQPIRNNWLESQDTRKITRSFSFEELQLRKYDDLAQIVNKRPKTSLFKKQDPLKSLNVGSTYKSSQLFIPRSSYNPQLRSSTCSKSLGSVQRDIINLKSNKLKSKQIPRLSVRELELTESIPESSLNIKTSGNPLTYADNIMEEKDKKSNIRLNMTLIMFSLLTVVTFVAVYNSLFAFVTQILVDLLCFVVPVSYLFNNQEIINFSERKLVRAYKNRFNQF